MKCESHRKLEGAIAQGRRDLAFLFFLYQSVNCHLASVAFGYFDQVEQLEDRLWDILKRNRLRSEIRKVHLSGIEKTAYPLDCQTASAVEAAVRHFVAPWPQISFTTTHWVFDHLIRQGKKKLPRSFPLLFLDRDDGNNRDAFLDDETLALEFFGDKSALQDYRAGKDFSWGFADVRDAEFRELADSVGGAIDDLVESGAVQAGTRVFLASVPIPFLQDVPLVANEWIDEFVVELAECGAILAERGYETEYSFHPLAWCRIFLPTGRTFHRNEARDSEIEQIHQDARNHVASFKGKRKEIDGRPYIHSSDYVAWKRRKVKVDMKKEMRAGRGLVLASWNAWVDAHGGEAKAELADVLAGKIDNGSVYKSSYRVVGARAKAVAAQQAIVKHLNGLREWARATPRERSAKFVVDSFWRELNWQLGPFDDNEIKEEADELHESTALLMKRTYASKAAIGRINEKFFEGQLVLWKWPAEWLDKAIQVFESGLPRVKSIADEMAKMYEFAAPRVPEIPRPEDIKKSIEALVQEEYARLVTSAKADMHFYFGEYQSGRDLVLPKLRRIMGEPIDGRSEGSADENLDKVSP